jgi:3-hydroxyacyl-CoA dehydrogenase/3a,7a,12a-trihydroxy-5b-cholest-24-enoyl-CoA hydratase
MPEELVRMLKPDFVTPLCVYLAHESCQSSGRIFEAGAGWYGTVQLYRSKGNAIPDADADKGKNWGKAEWNQTDK